MSSGEHDVVDSPLGTGPEFDHFARVRKMVGRVGARIFAGFCGLLDDRLEISPSFFMNDFLSFQDDTP